MLHTNWKDKKQKFATELPATTQPRYSVEFSCVIASHDGKQSLS